MAHLKGYYPTPQGVVEDIELANLYIMAWLDDKLNSDT